MYIWLHWYQAYLTWMHGSFLNSKGLGPDPKVLKKNTVHVCSHYDREKENVGLN